MSIIYYILGIVASVNEPLWRFRLNFIPVNILIMVGLAGVGGYALMTLPGSLRHGDEPLPLTVAEIRKHPHPEGEYVRASGLLFRQVGFRSETVDGSGRTRSVDEYSAFVDDPNATSILLVHHSRHLRLAGDDPQTVTLSGMLRRMDSELQATLAKNGNAIDDIPVETRVVLEPSERPLHPALAAAIAVICLGGSLSFGVVSLKRNTIFQPHDHAIPAPDDPDDDQAVVVHASGVFLLEQETGTEAQRFHSVPTVLVEPEDQNPLIVAHIDASSRFMGFRISERHGLWTMAIQNGSVDNIQGGYLYTASGRKPAVRFDYTDALDGVRRSAVLDAEDVGIVTRAIARIVAPRSSQDPDLLLDESPQTDSEP